MIFFGVFFNLFYFSIIALRQTIASEPEAAADQRSETSRANETASVEKSETPGTQLA